MPAGLTSPEHLFVIILVALIVLGPKRLPEAMRQVGRTIAEVRRWSDSISSEVQGALSLDTGDDAPAAQPAAAPPAAVVPLAPAVPPAPVVPRADDGNGDRQPHRHPALLEGGEWH